ncbi:hypothetical protein GQ44DRAFT_725988 [Phaeosphaeriaceae sp. PMI808]|nr:hypothetical protein GQ44DRAFT_725988 [Phaeosphaeriaceae sp. PMI808]
MASIAASRMHLQQLHNAVLKAQVAVYLARKPIPSAIYDESEDDQAMMEVDHASIKQLTDQLVRRQCVKLDTLDTLTTLHEKMCAKLPREIRDMIYSHLVFLDGETIYPGTFTYPIYSESSIEVEVDYELGQAIKAFIGGTLDTIEMGGWTLNADFVGQGMARENAELFYSINSGFYIQNALYLTDFLTNDRTRTGLKPYEHIRGPISLGIWTAIAQDPDEPAWQNTENEVAFLNKIYSIVSSLTLLACKSQVHLCLRFTTAPRYHSRIEGKRRLHNILETLREPFYRLIHGGWTTFIWHRADLQQRTGQLISRDPYRYFAMSKEGWDREKRTHGPDWLPSENFILREELESEGTEERLLKCLEQRWGHMELLYDYVGE